MKLVKKNIYHLEKCYSLAKIQYGGNGHIIVASEKNSKCIMFNLNGEPEHIIWNEPGGTMSICPSPDDGEGVFLATQKMYSPDESTESEIVMVYPDKEGAWKCVTIAKIPFAHRFGIVKANKKRYLVVSTLKSAHSYTGDWSTPGKYIAAQLPEHITDKTQLQWNVIVDGLFHNHGYCERHDKNGIYSVISADSGVYEIHPPITENDTWQVSLLTPDPTSDMAFLDFDGDGKDEMITLSPYHGDTIKLYKNTKSAEYECIYTFSQKRPFVHSIFAGKINEIPIAVIGHRSGASRDLMGFSFHNGIPDMEVLDKDCGSANVLYYKNGDRNCLVSANREIDEIAFYDFEM